MIDIRSLFLILFFNMLLFSCSSDKKVKVNLTGTSFHMIDSSQTYYFSVDNETETEAEANNTKIYSSRKSSIGFIYHAKKDSVGNQLLTITFDKLHFNIKTQDKEQEIDAETSGSSYNPTERMIAVLKGSSLHISMDRKGNVLSVNGYDSIINKMVLASGDKSVAFRETMQKEMTKLIGDEFVKGNIVETFSSLPDSTVQVGDSWERRSTQSAGLAFDMATVYTFSSLEKGIATIASKSAITQSTSKSSESNLLGMGNVTTDISGKQTGTLTINTTTGMVEKNTSSMEIEGTVNVSGKEIPIRIKSRKGIEVSKHF